LAREKPILAVVGLGYVGLPLAVAFSKVGYKVIGFDTSQQRIEELQSGIDATQELSTKALESLTGIDFTAKETSLQNADIYIITVQTPIDKDKKPDLAPLLTASKTVGRYLQKNNLVIYESTVYPGCTEEDCVPVLEKASGLQFNKDFYCGYSPERVNPGDKNRNVTNIRKVTSGSTPKIADEVDALYQSILSVPTHKASSIKIAEASKIIENTQRDLNISLINELALIFEKMNIDTLEVLEAAETKWNFLPFRPGLVGGHCIGVDPYYLTYKSEQLGYAPDVILSGRKVNDTMGTHIAQRILSLLKKNEQSIKQSKALVLGITFKENCPDIRNSRVIDVVKELQKEGVQVDVYDPQAQPDEVQKTFGISLIQSIQHTYEAIVLAVGHDEFKTLDISSIRNDSKSVIFDVKGFLPKQLVTDRL
jgi:UDP-N-acetyl-D-galactosamine dehydrogenase